MGLSHVAYVAVNPPSIKRVRPLVAITYAAEWQKHYEQEGYVNVDPVVRAGLGGVLPVDWSKIRSDDPLVLKFLGEAQEFKIGRAGLSIPQTTTTLDRNAACCLRQQEMSASAGS